jgi:hypothetical protein
MILGEPRAKRGIGQLPLSLSATEAVPPAFDCMTLGATRRFACSLVPEKTE